MSKSQHVGPIIVSVPEPQRQLREQGELITFRSNERTTGDTWWRESRTGPKQGDVLVEFLDIADPGNPFDLDPHQPWSGFETTPEWMGAIERVHGLGTGRLYRVTLTNEQ